MVKYSDISAFMPEFFPPLVSLLMATGLAGLIGLEREMRFQQKEPDGNYFGGLRTHSMMGAIGFLATFMSGEMGFSSFLIAVFCVVFILLFISHTILILLQKRFGITSHLSLVASFFIGILVAIEEPYLALSVSILFTGLLALKIGLHKIVRQISREELLAILQFFILSSIILPLLPEHWTDPFGFFDWRPQTVWLMVVLVVSLRFIGYFLSKFLGSEKSILLSGIVGGFVSSTAVTMGIAQESKDHTRVKIFLIPILVASGIMFFRVILEVMVSAPRQTELWQFIFPPLVTMGLSSFLLSGILIASCLRKKEKEVDSEPKTEMIIRQPLQMRSALTFGLFFLFVLLLADKVAELFSDEGLLIAAAIAGLSDVDAITLAASNLVRNGTIQADLASQVILVAVAVNTMVKAGLVFIFGSRKLFQFVFYSMGGVLSLGVLILLLLL